MTRNEVNYFWGSVGLEVTRLEFVFQIFLYYADLVLWVKVNPNCVSVSESSYNSLYSNMLCYKESVRLMYLVFKWVDVPKHLSLPPAMMANLVHSLSLSSILWVLRNTARPLASSEDNLSQTNLLVLGSIPAVGSSNRITLGFPKRDTAKQTSLLYPPLRTPVSLFSYLFKRKLLMHDSTSLMNKQPMPLNSE